MPVITHAHCLHPPMNPHAHRMPFVHIEDVWRAEVGHGRSSMTARIEALTAPPAGAAISSAVGGRSYWATRPAAYTSTCPARTAWSRHQARACQHHHHTVPLVVAARAHQHGISNMNLRTPLWVLWPSLFAHTAFSRTPRNRFSYAPKQSPRRRPKSLPLDLSDVARCWLGENILGEREHA